MKKRVLLISYHFYPDRAVGAKRPTQLAKKLASEGWEVDVLTKKLGPEAESDRATSQEYGQVISVYQHPGFLSPLWRIYKRFKGIQDQPYAEAKTNPSRKGTERQKRTESIRARLRRYVLSMQSLFDANKSWIFLSICYLIFLRAKKRKYDLIISSSPPASVHSVALVANLIFKSRWILDLRDPIAQWSSVYPECKTKFRVFVEDYFEKKYYMKGDKIIVTAPSLREAIVNVSGIEKNKISVIYNGYDGQFVPNQKINIKKVFGIYAGSLYFNRSPMNFLLAVKKLKEDGIASDANFRFDFFGDVSWDGNDLREFCIKSNIDDLVRVRGFLDPEYIEKELEEYNVFLNLAQKQKMQIPAKTFDYFKFNGVQIVVSEEDSDLYNLIMEKSLGLAVSDTMPEIFSVLRKIMKDGTDSYILCDEIKKRYSREYQNSVYFALVEKLVSPNEC